MNIIICMEVSGVIRDAFRARGHNAVSVDLKPAVSPHHIQGDVFEVLARHRYYGSIYDLAIFHPVCQFLSVSGYHWCYKDPAKYPRTICGPERLKRVEQAQKDFMRCVNAGKEFGIRALCVENPIGIMNTRYRKPSQTIQPYSFGDDASKATGLWLHNLIPLKPTQRIPGRMVDAGGGRMVERWANQTDSGQNKLGPSPTRAADRAVTYPGIAAAMAEQWG